MFSQPGQGSPPFQVSHTPSPDRSSRPRLGGAKIFRKRHIAPEQSGLWRKAYAICPSSSTGNRMPPFRPSPSGDLHNQSWQIPGIEFGIPLITGKTLDARRREATTEAYTIIRRKEERVKGTRLELCEIPSSREDDALLVIKIRKSP